MLIVLLWLGSVLPDRYLKVITDCQSYKGNRCVLLQQVHWDYLFPKYKQMLNLTQKRIDSLIMVQKVDILRYLYLYDKGGIYTDLDNTINYTCLQNFISKNNDTFYFGHEQYDIKNASNNFIYSPYPRHPQLKRVITRIRQCESCTDLKFASPWYLNRIKVPYKVLTQCIKHGYQSSWYWPRHRELKSPRAARIEADQKEKYAKQLAQKNASELQVFASQRKKQAIQFIKKCPLEQQIISEKCFYFEKINNTKQKYESQISKCYKKVAELNTTKKKSENPKQLIDDCQNKLAVSELNIKNALNCSNNPSLNQCQQKLDKSINQRNFLNKSNSQMKKQCTQTFIPLDKAIIGSASILLLFIICQIIFCCKNRGQRTYQKNRGQRTYQEKKLKQVEHTSQRGQQQSVSSSKMQQTVQE